MLTGTHGDYHWMELKDGFMWALLERFPQIVLEKFLVNTSFDSSRLEISVEEIEKGWRKYNDLTLIPPMMKLDYLPANGYDEWYIFDPLTLFDEHEVFINYGGFSLRESGWKEGWREMQERFWQQLETFQPESYLAEGDYLIWVTRNTELFYQVISSLKNEGLRT